jgi:hypothetical protein
MDMPKKKIQSELKLAISYCKEELKAATHDKSLHERLGKIVNPFFSPHAGEHSLEVVVDVGHLMHKATGHTLLNRTNESHNTALGVIELLEKIMEYQTIELGSFLKELNYTAGAAQISRGDFEGNSIKVEAARREQHRLQQLCGVLNGSDFQRVIDTYRDGLGLHP